LNQQCNARLLREVSLLEFVDREASMDAAASALSKRRIAPPRGAHHEPLGAYSRIGDLDYSRRHYSFAAPAMRTYLLDSNSSSDEPETCDGHLTRAAAIFT
jgi:hypothetical protein